MDAVKQSKLSQWVEHSNALLCAHAQIYRSEKGLRADETALIFQASLQTSGSYFSDVGRTFHLYHRPFDETPMDSVAPVDLTRAQHQGLFPGSGVVGLLLAPIAGLYGVVPLLKQALADRALRGELDRLKSEIEKREGLLNQITSAKSNAWSESYQFPFTQDGDSDGVRLVLEVPLASGDASSSTIPNSKKLLKAYNCAANGALRIARYDAEALTRQLEQLKRTEGLRYCAAFSLACWNLFGVLALYSIFRPLSSSQWLRYTGYTAAATTGLALGIRTPGPVFPSETGESLSSYLDQTKEFWNTETGIDYQNFEDGQFTEFGGALLYHRAICSAALKQGDLNFSEPITFVWQEGETKHKGFDQGSMLPEWKGQGLSDDYWGLAFG